MSLDGDTVPNEIHGITEFFLQCRRVSIDDVNQIAVFSDVPVVSRFATCFRSVLDGIPDLDKQPILKHWVQGKGLSCDEREILQRLRLLRAPIILFWGEDTDVLDESGRRIRPAHTVEPGHMMKFCSYILATLPHDVVSAVVAHELAHVHLYATSTGSAAITMDREEIETAAEETMRIWGFDNQTIHDGLRTHLLALEKS